MLIKELDEWKVNEDGIRWKYRQLRKCQRNIWRAFPNNTKASVMDIDNNVIFIY